MRLLHTSDWHLGRQLERSSLIEDQRHALAQVAQIAEAQAVDAVLIAGDVYDRAVPPPEAVTLLDEILRKLVLDLRLPVVMIAGNHDSGRRLAFGADLLASGGLHVAGTLSQAPTPVLLEGRDGVSVAVHSVPYAEPPEVRHALGDDTLRSHADAMQALVGRIERVEGARNVLMAHAFVAGALEVSDSERNLLSVGGSGHVPPAVFADFDYVALGHLHRPQRAGAEHIRYSGSLLKYSFSEETHVKGVSIVDLPAAGAPTVEHVPTQPLRDVRTLAGDFEALIEAASSDPNRLDYVFAELRDRDLPPDPYIRLREAYPNLVGMRRAQARVEAAKVVDARVQRQMSDLELFGQFFEQVEGEPMDEASAALLEEVLAEIEAGRREAGGGTG